jgi:hypothetical protein
LATTKALNNEFYLSKKYRNISYIFLTDYKKAATFSKKFFKDINYSSISNKFEPEVAKELGKYLLKVVEGKTSNIVYLTK